MYLINNSMTNMISYRCYNSTPWHLQKYDIVPSECGREVGIQFIHSNRLDYRVTVIDDGERPAECGLTKTAP